MKVQYLGHSCFTVQAAGKIILFDPYITENELAKSIDINKVQADYILISHGHSDHVGDTLRIAQRTQATVVCPYEVGEWLVKKGLKKVHEMNPGGGWNFDFGRVKMVHAVHSSSMEDGTYGGSPCGFVVETSDGNWYYSGDTALTLDMKLIGESTRLDFAALCIGDNFTMGIDDAIKASDFVGCSKILGVHYDTFPQIRLDKKDDAIKRFKQAGKILLLPRIGETVEV